MDSSREYLSKSEIVYRTVKEKIESGELAPGQIFSAKEIARELGVSRTPVNDAMKKMGEYGLVRVLPHVGYEVKRLNWKEIKDIMLIEGCLEKEAVNWCGQQPDPTILAELRENSEKIMEALEKRDRRTYNILTNNFHSRFMDLSGSRVLKDIFLKSRHYAGWDDAEMIAMTDKLAAINREHESILDMVEQGKIDRACNLLDEHMDHCISMVYQGLKEQEYPGF